MDSRPWVRRLLLLILLLCTTGLSAGEALHLYGFGYARGSTDADGPLEQETLTLQLQTGVDWFPSPRVRAHLHLLARDGRPDRENEQLGIVEAWVEANLQREAHRVKLRGGAFFLPTSREHVDALWDTPYSLTPSALNLWLGEELRPIGADVEYRRGGLTGGLTLFRGNDAFGTLTAARGWSLADHIALLDEEIDVTELTQGKRTISQISAELDDRLGWSGRVRWSGRDALLQITFVDNRADGFRYGDILTWRTPFYVVSGEINRGDWTVAAEHGWGRTFAYIPSGEISTDLEAGYLLVSRFFPRGRGTVRADAFAIDGERDYALTAAWIWMLPRRFRAGLEAVTTGDDTRLLGELRYTFTLR
ncbi:MAG TPA: hypothetical protein VM534_09010 [Thermoanaerobaculia bacterium]|nr:hypothetical protein [Thermoanaerobaculia bacterium]